LVRVQGTGESESDGEGESESESESAGENESERQINKGVMMGVLNDKRGGRGMICSHQRAFKSKTE